MADFVGSPGFKVAQETLDTLLDRYARPPTAHLSPRPLTLSLAFAALSRSLSQNLPASGTTTLTAASPPRTTLPIDRIQPQGTGTDGRIDQFVGRGDAAEG